VRTLCVTIGIIAVVAFAFPLFMVAVVPLTYFYMRTTSYYLATSRGKLVDSRVEYMLSFSRIEATGRCVKKSHL
jgi:hypothetical protein